MAFDSNKITSVAASRLPKKRPRSIEKGKIINRVIIPHLVLKHWLVYLLAEQYRYWPKFKKVLTRCGFQHKNSQCVTVTDWLLEIGFSGTKNMPKNGFKKQVEQGFSSFCPKFFSCLMIFQSSSLPSEHSTLKNHQIYQKFDKK